MEMFKDWDWIQWYLFVCVFLNLALGFFLDGHEKSYVNTHHSFRRDVLAFFFALPIIGRVFGWW